MAGGVPKTQCRVPAEGGALGPLVLSLGFCVSLGPTLMDSSLGCCVHTAGTQAQSLTRTVALRREHVGKVKALAMGSGGLGECVSEPHFLTLGIILHLFKLLKMSLIV